MKENRPSYEDWGKYLKEQSVSEDIIRRGVAIAETALAVKNDDEIPLQRVGAHDLRILTDDDGSSEEGGGLTHQFSNDHRKGRRRYKVEGDEGDGGYEPGFFDMLMGDAYPLAQGDFLSRIWKKERRERLINRIEERGETDQACMDACQFKCRNKTNLSYLDDVGPMTQQQRGRIRNVAKDVDDLRMAREVEEAILLENLGYGELNFAPAR
jgi:hypothetical protein